MAKGRQRPRVSTMNVLYRGTAPVKERQVPEAVDLRRQRARLMQEVKRLEWKFDKDATLQTAGLLSNKRKEISKLEAQIAECSEMYAVQELLSRMEKVATYTDSSGGSRSSEVSAKD